MIQWLSRPSVYLVVVYDPTEPEARSQTVGLFGTESEADEYAKELNASWPAGQADRAFTQTWVMGDKRM